MTTYDGVPRETWINGLTETDKYNVKHTLALFALLGVPESYMDAGCGTGAMVKTAQRLGVRAYGLDQLVEPEWGEGFYHVNLVDRFLLPEPVDVVTSFEVAEHLHESAHSTFCDTLCDNLKIGAGHHLVFSAARPGQGGTGHIACKPAEYWHNEMILRGLTYNAFMTLRLAHLFSNIESPLNYLWDNLIVFTR
jgi:cyclopropane fatty-acyl-phospholipid synthase-like methyltransferase